MPCYAARELVGQWVDASMPSTKHLDLRCSSCNLIMRAASARYLTITRMFVILPDALPASQARPIRLNLAL